MEIASSDERMGAQTKLENTLHVFMEDFLANAFEDGLVTDATLAQNETQRQNYGIYVSMDLSRQNENQNL